MTTSDSPAHGHLVRLDLAFEAAAICSLLTATFVDARTSRGSLHATNDVPLPLALVLPRSIRIPSRAENRVQPPCNCKRAVVNGYKIRLVILTNRNRFWSHQACGDGLWRLRARWGVSTTQVRGTAP